MSTYPITEVDIDLLKPNTWNPNKQSDFMFQKEKASIQEFDFIDPVTVRELNGELEIVDGEHRWKAAKQLGRKTILIVNLGVISKAQAQTLTDVMNNLRGRYDPYRQARLIQEVLSRAPDLRKVLPYKDEQIDRYTKTIDWDKLGSANVDAQRETLNCSWDAVDFAKVKEAIDAAKKKLPRGERTNSHAILSICHQFITTHQNR